MKFSRKLMDINEEDGLKCLQSRLVRVKQLFLKTRLI